MDAICELQVLSWLKGGITYVADAVTGGILQMRLLIAGSQELRELSNANFFLANRFLAAFR